MSSNKFRFLPLPVLIIVVALDQFTKHLIRTNLAVGESIPGQGFFQFVHAQNTGASFGLFENATPFLIATSSIALVFIAWLTLSHRVAFLEGIWGRLALGLAAGGTLGNLIDRAYYGYVTDFLKAGPWPAFNVADASVVTGMTLLAFLYLRSGHLSDEKV
jgi:signal peptidase II